MRRREFVALLGGAAAWPVVAVAQTSGNRKPSVGIMIPVPEQDWQGQAWIKGFIAGLQSYGWVEGENILIHRRWGAGDVQRMAVLAKELVEARPDVLLAGSTPVLAALKKETSTVPIVSSRSRT